MNTIRIVTLNKKVVAAFIRFGNLGNIVDNFKCYPQFRNIIKELEFID